MDALPSVTYRRTKTNTVGVRVDGLDSIDAVIAPMLQALELGRPWLITFVNPGTAVVTRHLRAGLGFTCGGYLDQLALRGTQRR